MFLALALPSDLIATHHPRSPVINNGIVERFDPCFS